MKPEGFLVQAMWAYSAAVFHPVRSARRRGWLPPRPVKGDLPERMPGPGLGRQPAIASDKPVLLQSSTSHDSLVEEFDRMGEVYDAFVRPFSGPIFDEALQVMQDFLVPDAAVLDAGCGCGREMQQVAARVPDGMVVGVDLAAGMVNAAHASARAHGLDHCAFYQADVGDLPKPFTDRFDLVYSCLAHHHYPDPVAASREILRVLRPGGVYCIVDAGPEWYTRLASPLAKWADPGWIGFHSPDEFRSLLLAVGFERHAWVDTLPGFGVSIAQKSRHASP
jgi:ubiquinone/menaquinone biosynthesis C-methylase UbiE